MKPVSISEKMMFNTVRLVSTDGSSGTGYFYYFYIGGTRNKETSKSLVC